jgi:diguanylate cyclase (GGDEF)-like protein
MLANPLRSRALPLYLGTVMVLAVVSLVASALRYRHEGDLPVLALALFAACVLVGELRPQRWLKLQDGGEITATWTFGFAMLYLAPPPWPMLLMGAATAIAELAQWKGPVRSAFNAAQMVLAVGVGAVVFGTFADRSELAIGRSISLGWLVAAIAASAAATITNNLLTCGAIALHQKAPIRAVIRDSIGVYWMMDGLLIALGPVFAVTATTSFVVVPLLLITVLIVHLSGAAVLRNRHEATHDLLTGLPNRRFFLDQTQIGLDAARRSGRQSAVILIDLDGFKDINDRLGHHWGDLALQEVAGRLLAAKAPSDMVARLGGDEFAILLREVDTADDAIYVAEQFVAAVTRPMEVGGLPLAVGGSFGVALFPLHGEELTKLLHNADMAMYEAKQHGGGVRMFQHASTPSVPTRAGLAADLRQAMERDELYLDFQPRLSLASGRAATVEALVRWHHPVHGVIMPGRFMPLAEQSDLMDHLTSHIARLAIRQVVSWRERGIDLRIAINASARNLHDLHFAASLAAMLDGAGALPGWIEIEITENTVMSDPLRSAAIIRQLREMGITIAIDDFGTGFSSLANLRDLTLDWLKIDASFVSGLVDRPENLVIVRSVIDLARNLGLRTVAEGVENEAELRLLRTLGCDEVQGYFIGTPMPPDALLAWQAARSAEPPSAAGAGCPTDSSGLLEEVVRR